MTKPPPEPARPRTPRGWALLQGLALLGAAAAALWAAPMQAWSHGAAIGAALAVAAWAGVLSVRGRLCVPVCLMVQSAALAAVSSALHWPEWHGLSKPLPLSMLR